jgi:antitoxin (DNA-binding transcriptional repressor) of toxin-antitoxin stability system
MGTIMEELPPKPPSSKAAARKVTETVIGVTTFKVKCLALIDAVATGKLERVVLTKRGKPVAEISALKPGTKKPYVTSYGFMKGRIWIDPNYDLTQPIEDIEWDAEKGILYWGPEGPVHADE